MINTKDKNQFITSVKQVKGYPLARTQKVSVVLLAENYGYRMKSYGPISLIKVGDKTLLEHQVEAIGAAFINFEIILCSGFETNKVYHFVKNTFENSLPIRIVENQMFFHSNCCEGVRLCINNASNDNIIICGGGVVLDAEYLRHLNMKKSSILCQEGEKNDIFNIGIINNDSSRLENLSLAVQSPVWTELIYLTGETTIRSFYNLVSKPEMKNKFLFEAINTWRARKQLDVDFLKTGKKINKIDNIKTLKRINKEL